MIAAIAIAVLGLYFAHYITHQCELAEYEQCMKEAYIIPMTKLMNQESVLLSLIKV